MNALLVDIGNSRIKWRLDDLARSLSVALDHDALSSNDALPLTEIDRFAEYLGRIDRPIDMALISNVASADKFALVEANLTARWPALRLDNIVSSPNRGGVINGYAEPSRLGPDRWLALIGAHALEPDRPLLVCTFGTATTIDLLLAGREHSATRGGTADAVFVGGLILPGFVTMRDALVNGTARLPDEHGAIVDFANNTADAIASGIVSAQLGAVERAIRDARSQLQRDVKVRAQSASSAPAHQDPACLVAGGAAPLIAPHLHELRIRHRLVPDLVLRGLAVVARDASLNYHATADSVRRTAGHT
jgi:type III pantothenate kinase